jgi:hypothetical protein
LALSLLAVDRFLIFVRLLAALVANRPVMLARR